MEPPSSTTAADISSIRRSVDESLAKIDILIESLKLEKEKIRSTIEKRIEELALTRYTTTEQKEELDNFLKEPYVIIPKKENEFYVIAPRWLNFQIGWLERQTKSVQHLRCKPLRPVDLADTRRPKTEAQVSHRTSSARRSLPMVCFGQARNTRKMRSIGTDSSYTRRKERTD